MATILIPSSRAGAASSFITATGNDKIVVTEGLGAIDLSRLTIRTASIPPATAFGSAFVDHMRANGFSSTVIGQPDAGVPTWATGFSSTKISSIQQPNQIIHPSGIANPSVAGVGNVLNPLTAATSWIIGGSRAGFGSIQLARNTVNTATVDQIPVENLGVLTRVRPVSITQLAPATGFANTNGFSITNAEIGSVSGSTGTAPGSAIVLAVGSPITRSSGLSIGTSQQTGAGISTALTVGTATGASTSLAQLATPPSVATASGSSTASALTRVNMLGVGTATGSSTAVGVGFTIILNVAGTSAGSSTADAVGSSNSLAIGTSSGSSTSHSIPVLSLFSLGRITASSTAIGGGGVGRLSTISTDGTSTADAEGSSTAETVGTASGSAFADGSAGHVVLAIARSTETSTANAVGRANISRAGTSVSTSTANAVGVAYDYTVATSDGAGSADAIGESIAAAVGSADSAALVSAVTIALIAATGLSDSTSDAEAIATALTDITGISDNGATDNFIGMSLAESIGTSETESDMDAFGVTGHLGAGFADGNSTADGVTHGVAIFTGFAEGKSLAVAINRSMRLYYPSTNLYTIMNNNALPDSHSFLIPTPIDGNHSGPRVHVFPFSLRAGTKVNISIARIMRSMQDGSLTFWLSEAPMDNVLFTKFNYLTHVHLKPSLFQMTLYDSTLDNIPKGAFSLIPDTVYFANIQNNATKVDEYKLIIN